MRISILLILAFILNCKLNSQIDITINIGNATPDSIILAKYLGKRIVKIGSINRTGTSSYHLTNRGLEPGIYTLIYKRDNLSTDERKTNLLIDEGNQKFQIKVGNFFINDAAFEGSEDNVLLKKYQKSLDSIFTAYRKAKDEWIVNEDIQSFQVVANLEKLITIENERIIQHTSSKFLQSVISNFNVEFPKYTGSLESQKAQRQSFYDNNFLKQIKVSDKNYQIIEQGIDFFDLYSIYSSDGEYKIASERSTTLLNKLIKENKPVANYYLNYLFNSYPKMTAHGYDAVTIDLVNNFLNNGDNYDLPADKIERMKTAAVKIKSMLPGEALQPLTLQKEDKTQVTIQDIKSKYTILVVWSPDCGHCKKELPILKEKFEKYKSKGITIATICNKRGVGLAECINYMTSQNMPIEWLKLNDDNGASGYVSKLDATSYPAFYLLDENKKFIMKRRGELTSAELEKIFKNL